MALPDTILNKEMYVQSQNLTLSYETEFQYDVSQSLVVSIDKFSLRHFEIHELL